MTTTELCKAFIVTVMHVI